MPKTMREKIKFKLHLFMSNSFNKVLQTNRKMGTMNIKVVFLAGYSSILTAAGDTSSLQ